MARITIWFGAALIVLGVVGYVGSGADSLTALIPSVVGVILAGLGLAGRGEDRPVLMGVAVAIAIVAILGSIQGLVDLPDLLAGEDLERPWAVAVQSIMAVALLAYLALAAKHFLDRRNDAAGA